MDQAVAYTTLAMTVSLAVLRPRMGLRSLRFSPGSAAVLGVAILLVSGLLGWRDLIEGLKVQWRPLLTLTSIMVMAGVVHEAGAFERLGAWVEARARRVSVARAFTGVFVLSVIVPSLLNNDAAILILTPLVVVLTRRLYPGREDLTIAFAFAVFLAPGVAPFIVSNPMNMIAADYAGIGFNEYAKVMLPISLACVVATYVVLRFALRRVLRPIEVATDAAPRPPVARHPAQLPAVVLLIVVFAAYPIGTWYGLEVWAISATGALISIGLALGFRVAPVGKVLGHVPLDVLTFLWGILLVVQGLRAVGIVDWLSSTYAGAPAGSGAELGRIGVVAAFGSAVINNHPMSILNMMAIDVARDTRPLLAALIGGDLGPRLLPIGSLAGLLWMDRLRRVGVRVPIRRFVVLGALVLAPSLPLALFLLWIF